MIRLIMLTVCCMFATAALADDSEMPKMHHPVQDLQDHYDIYMNWKRSDGITGCCGKGDCYATAARFNRELGLWEAKRREDKKWLIIPRNVFDNGDPKAQRSPDGRSHLCAPPPGSEDGYEVKNTSIVFCFKPGVGI